MIPVSGGKDSHFQTHVIKQEFGLRRCSSPTTATTTSTSACATCATCASASAAITSSSRPNVEALKKLNRLCFRIMGDMNWHAHCGIFTYPVRVAVQHKIPLIIWGEHGFTTLPACSRSTTASR